jgi:hypothetical protein
MVERAGIEAKLGFKVHPHMLRHACGYALANRGHDTRALQAYLGSMSNVVEARFDSAASFNTSSHGFTSAFTWPFSSPDLPANIVILPFSISTRPPASMAA